MPGYLPPCLFGAEWAHIQMAEICPLSPLMNITDRMIPVPYVKWATLFHATYHRTKGYMLMMIQQCFSERIITLINYYSEAFSQIYLFRIHSYLRLAYKPAPIIRRVHDSLSRMDFIYHNKLSSQFKFFFYQPISEFYTTVLRIYWVDIYLDSSSFFTRRQYAHHIIWETCKDFILLQEVQDTIEIIFGFFLHSMARYMSAFWMEHL